MQMDSSFWSDFKSTMKIKSGPNKLLENYLDPIDFVKFEKDEQNVILTLGVPNRFFYFYANENLKDKIYIELKTAYPDLEINIQFIITEKVNQDYNLSLQNILQNSEQIFQNLPATQKTVFPIERSHSNENINTDLTFNTFVVGKNSEFAHAATYNVAQNPGIEDYNPLFIYGPSGMGKTHLLNAAANHIKENFPHYRITYISAERFLNECVAALRRHEMDKFRQKYRENTDILVVDDVQYIGRGQAVQEEFFHMINMLIEKKKQIILASDRMPKDIGLEDRARTRLERGLIADIIMPDLETRIAILRYKAEKYNVRMAEDVVNHIARISKRSIRELEGNLKKVKMFSELQGLQIDYDLVKKILSNHETQTMISVEEIQRIVSEHFKVKIQDLKSATRAKQIVVPRQIAMHLIKKFLDKSLVDIGKAFGGKDHTTVMNALGRVKHLQQTDQDMFKNIEELESRIHNITGV